MAVDFYLLENPLKSSTKFIPRTLTKGTIHQDKLVDLMVGANTSLTGPDIKGMMLLLEQVLLKQLEEGYSVELGNILRLSPLVRGNFMDFDLRKDPGQASLDVNCRIRKSFLKELRSNTKIEKRDHEIRMPTIRSIMLRPSEELGKKPRDSYRVWKLHPIRSLYIRGSRLKDQGLEMTGLTLNVRLEKMTELFVPLDQLDVLVHTPTKFIFSFGPDFQKPSWLKPGLEMGFWLNYRHYVDAEERQSNPVAVIWEE